jgi:hypothetical protein
VFHLLMFFSKQHLRVQALAASPVDIYPLINPDCCFIQHLSTIQIHKRHFVSPLSVFSVTRCAACTRRCGCNDGKADAISTLLDDAKALVQRARDSAGAETSKGPVLTVDQANAQVLYETVALWELHVEVLMGLVVVSSDGTVKGTHEGRLSYKDGTVAFGRHLDAKWDGVVKSLKPRFQSVAMARHWYLEPVHCWHCV